MSEGIIIIGNGIAGITAARHIRKRSDARIRIISSETEHFFSRTALMYVYMGHMKYENIKPYEDFFWEKNRLELIFGRVTALEVADKKIELQDGQKLGFEKLVLATGSKPQFFNWPGQDLKGVQGLYSWQDLEQMEANTQGIRRAVIVGGGLIGIEMAEMLRSREIEVTFLVRETEFWSNVLPIQEAKMLGNHILKHHVDLRLSEELDEILGDENGRVIAVKTKSGETIDCEFVGLTTGVKPNIDFLQESKLEVDRGILVDQYLETSEKDIYAIGDCAQLRKPEAHRRAIEPVWYSGRMMGETIGETLGSPEGEKKAYRPGPWFNSAKFFDIEYQTYGDVPPKLNEGQREFYWEKEEKALHIVWEEKTGKFIGINSFNLRLKHELFDHWLTEEKSVEEVLRLLKEANFDPEFYKSFERDIIQDFNEKNPDMEVKLKEKRRLFNWK